MLLVVYLAAAIALAWTRWAPPGRRRAIALLALLDLTAVCAGAWVPGFRESSMRDWVPPLHLFVAYRLSGWFFRAPDRGLERWLVWTDAWVFDRLGLDGFVRRSPRIVLEVLEGMYASVYALVPAGFLIARLSPGLDVDRYWTVVLAPMLAAYAMLPWLQSRTPLALGDHAAITTRPLQARRLNVFIARNASIQVCTIPSGHAAGSVATALALTAVSPWAAAVMAVFAAGIGMASVTGRYHFAVDIASGAGLAVAVWIVATVAR
jgi:membrane-associated phospholipid phosphatase